MKELWSFHTPHLPRSPFRSITSLPSSRGAMQANECDWPMGDEEAQLHSANDKQLQSLQQPSRSAGEGRGRGVARGRRGRGEGRVDEGEAIGRLSAAGNPMGRREGVCVVRCLCYPQKASKGNSKPEKCTAHWSSGGGRRWAKSVSPARRRLAKWGGGRAEAKRGKERDNISLPLTTWPPRRV